MRNKIFCFFIFFSSLTLCADPITPETLAHRLLRPPTTKESFIQEQDFFKANLPTLEKVIFDLRDPGARGNALHLFARFSRIGATTKEIFFDIVCRFIKNIDKISPRYSLNEEIQTLLLYVSGYGYHFRSHREFLPFSANIEAFVIFLLTMKKYDLIQDSKTFDSIRVGFEDIQLLFTTKGEGWRDNVIEKLSSLEKKVEILPSTMMDSTACYITKFYLKGLVAQAATLKP